MNDYAMIALSSAEKECPQCENHSMYSTKINKKKWLLFNVYSHTEWHCLICTYHLGKTTDVKRNEALENLGL